MKEPSSLEALVKRETVIPIERLISNGRGLTVEQFLEAKSEFLNDDKMRKDLIRDRETFIVYKDNNKNMPNKTDIEKSYCDSDK